MQLRESHLAHHIVDGSLHGDSLLLLPVVGHSLVDGGQKQGVGYLTHTEQGVCASSKVLFDRLQSAVDVPVELVLSRGSLFRD